MSVSLNANQQRFTFAALFLSAIAAFMALILNTSIAGLRPLEKFPPDWTPAAYSAPELLVLMLSAVSGAILAVFVQNGSFKSVESKRQDFQWALPVGVLNTTLLLLAVVLTIAKPESFFAHIGEIGAISLAQSVLIAIAVAIFIRLSLARNAGCMKPVFGIPFRAVTTLCGLMLFLLLMEEISWGQSYLGWATPDMFAANIQNETNLHNFYTYRFELAYYTGAALAFCVLPIWVHSANVAIARQLRPIVPAPLVGIAGLPLTAFLFESWSIVPLQIFFFLGLALAWSFYRRMQAPHSALPLAIFASMLISQIFFVFEGHRLVGGHEYSEMRELVISVMIFAYAAWLYSRWNAARALPA
ncbi:MAG: hypothetical protein AAF724_10870 [Pseudomonadota bacterium]